MPMGGWWERVPEERRDDRIEGEGGEGCCGKMA